VVDLLRPDEGLARQVITSSANPGLTVLSAYTYSHVPMLAGIIAVADDELIVAHPGVQGTLASVALTLGGMGLTCALASPVYPVGAGCSPPCSNGRIIHPPS
jgi:low temperature requirement protein LtrA